MRGTSEGRSGVFVRGIAVWTMIILLETVHGTIRVLFIEPLAGDLRARQIGVFVGSLMILAAAAVTVRWIGTRRPYELIAIGTMWVVLTVSFELLLGIIVMGASMDRIISDYDITRGGFMLFGLFAMLAAPYLAVLFRDRFETWRS